MPEGHKVVVRPKLRRRVADTLRRPDMGRLPRPARPLPSRTPKSLKARRRVARPTIGDTEVVSLAPSLVLGLLLLP